MEEKTSNIEQPKKNSPIVLALMGVAIVTLSVLCVLFATDVISFEENNTKCDTTPAQEDISHQDNNNNDSTTSQKSSVSKSQIIAYYKDSVSTIADKSRLYSIADINNDDIPELFVGIDGMIGSQIISEVSISSYDENKGSKDNNYLVGLGTIKGRYNVFYKMNDGTLLVINGHMGYESSSHYKLENDWLVKTDFSSRQIGDGEDYAKGDSEIVFKPLSDTSLFDNYK